ncbi:hypothetical protein [Streptomyces sp. NBC_01176]|uniref:hypothetical protein n=1 Tax=Streptomyces sp. NBC_01176 TaxID=2903760 RepID=UPI00386C3C23|nr:hypothetical protein OG199_06780 [Streptomyces sp. NBC_01176]
MADLAAHPRLARHSAALRDLADAVSSGRGLEVWAGGSLVTAYGGPDALGDGPAEKGDRARRLGLLPTALVFVPLLITWFGLGAAAWANQRMTDSGNRSEGSFLTLWQQGFDGHLWPFLRFDMMAVWTVLALAALATTTMLRHRWEERDERERLVLSQRLSGALAQTEALAVRAAATSPRRFTEELQGAAAELHTLLGRAVGVQEGARRAVAQADGATDRTVTALASLDSALVILRAGASEAREATRGASTAAGQVAQGADVLTNGVAASVAALRDSVGEAGRIAAEHIGAAGASVADRFDAVASAAELRGSAVADRATESMERIRDEARDSLERAQASLTESTRLLTATVQGLDRTLTSLPTALEGSAAEGADRIGMAYDMAVTALAASLRQEVREVSAELADRIDQLHSVVNSQRAIQRDLGGGQQQIQDLLRTATADFEQALRRVTGGLDEAGRAVVHGSAELNAAARQLRRTADDSRPSAGPAPRSPSLPDPGPGAAVGPESGLKSGPDSPSESGPESGPESGAGPGSDTPHHRPAHPMPQGVGSHPLPDPPSASDARPRPAATVTTDPARANGTGPTATPTSPPVSAAVPATAHIPEPADTLESPSTRRLRKPVRPDAGDERREGTR